jgi:hypothetical protein
MGHCVGGYCNNVHSGASVIFSLRDPKGEPHATIELDGSPGSYNVVQVQGKQNSEPSSEYKSMVKNFFDQLKQQGIDVTQRVRIRDVNELEEYEWMSRPDEAYGLEIDADIDEDGIARDLVGHAADGYGDESVAGTLQDLMHDGIIDYRTMESYIKDEIESRVEDKARELENDWEEQKKYLYQDFQQAREEERGDEEEDDGEFHEPEDDTQDFNDWLEENYPEQVYAERDNFEEAALDEMPQVYDLKQRFGSVQKWSYWPDQGGGDPRPDKMGPTLNTDYAPLEDTFDALGPCQKCNNPLTRDAEGVYCPSCGYRSNPQAENARIDMYAPLGEGIGEGPFGLMSKWALPSTNKTAINWPWQKPKSPGDWMQWVGDPEKNPFDQKNVPEGWKVPPWMKGEESLGDAIQRGMANGLEMQRLLESPNPVDYAQGAALHTKSLGYYHPEDEQDQFYSTIETLMYEYGLDEKDAWHFLSQAWTEQGLSMPSGRDSFSKWTADVWWLPNKTAADVQELAAKASDKIWQRPDLAKYLNALNEVIDILSESGMAVDLSDFYEEDNTAFDMLVRSYDQSKQAGEEWDSDHVADIMKQNYGYGEQYIRDSINATPKIAPLWQDFKLGRFYHELISTMAGRYPAGYKLIPWAVNQLKKQLKDHYDINRNDVNHLADIAGQFGELTTELRRQNKLPQGFDVNGVDIAGAEDWMREYHAQHVGEGWDERNVWATLPNGWTVEEVKTKNDLQREGELMGHCVGGYCRNVEKGTSLIFSLRDPNGAPHVTFEYKPIYDQVNDDGGPWVDPIWNPKGSKITRLELVQVQGKSDSKPKPEYQQMVAEFNKYLQGEGYQVVWSDNAWRHDRGRNDQQLMQLRSENTYDLRGIEGLHNLEQDYDQNGGTSYFTKQLPDIADEYGILSPSGVPEQHLNWGQLSTATDDLLYEVFIGKITPDQYEEYGRKLVVAWYSWLSQPYASQMRGLGGSPKSPVDARTMLVQHIGTYGAKLVSTYNESMKGVPGGQWQSQSVIDGMTNLTGFQRTIGDRTGSQMLDWTQPAIGPGWNEKQDDSTLDFARRHRWDAVAEEPGANAGDYIPQDEPGFHPEAAAAPEFVPYKFTVGKDGRIYGGQHYEHRPLIEGYGLDRDPGWTEVARGEYNPDGGMTLAEFANSPFGAENLANRVHQWAGTVNDPNIPVPNGDVRYNQWIQGQGWDKRQFRIAAAKWSMPMTIPQQQRAWEQTGANPETVYQFDNGWTVRHMQTSSEVHSVGLLCRNCWQDFEADMSNGSNYYALFNQHNLPIIAFYVSGGNVGRIELPRGPRNRLIAPEEDQMLKEFAQAWRAGIS